VSYEPLHHKYRPQTFGELVGQDAIATVVSQKEGSGKVGKLKTLIRPFHVYSLSIQVAALSARNHLAQRALVLPLCLELQGLRTDNGGTRD